MKLVSMKLSLVVASAALVLAGCTKKPTRPGPDQTLLGQQPGGSNLDTTPTTESFPGAPDLKVRDGFDLTTGQNRAALQGQTVYFELNSSNIRPAEREKLRVAKEYMDKNPNFKLLLEGHCDWRGTAEYNLSLGDRRANAVKRYLQTLGVPPDRLETLSKGSLEAAKQADEATMEKDRRVDLVVVDPGAIAAKPATL